MKTEAEIMAAVEDAKREILADIAAGVVPDSVPDFSALHDYVDANEYAGFCDDARRGNWLHDTQNPCNVVQNVVAEWLRQRHKITAVHRYAGCGGMEDTETTVTWIPGSSTVRVHVREVPYLRYWTCPPADVMRKWVDALIKGHGVKRDGARMEENAYMDGWKYVYYVKTI